MPLGSPNITSFWIYFNRGLASFASVVDLLSISDYLFFFFFLDGLSSALQKKNRLGKTLLKSFRLVYVQIIIKIIEN